MGLSAFKMSFRGASRVFGNLESSKGVLGVLGEDANCKEPANPAVVGKMWRAGGGEGGEALRKP